MQTYMDKINCINEEWGVTHYNDQEVNWADVSVWSNWSVDTSGPAGGAKFSPRDKNVKKLQRPINTVAPRTAVGFSQRSKASGGAGSKKSAGGSRSRSRS